MNRIQNGKTIYECSTKYDVKRITNKQTAFTAVRVRKKKCSFSNQQQSTCITCFLAVCNRYHKNRLKLFIYSQWTTKWSSIDQLTIVTFSIFPKETPNFYSCVHSEQCTRWDRFLSQMNAPLPMRKHAKSPFMLPLCLLHHKQPFHVASKTDNIESSMMLAANPQQMEFALNIYRDEAWILLFGRFFRLFGSIYLENA